MARDLLGPEPMDISELTIEEIEDLTLQLMGVILIRVPDGETVILSMLDSLTEVAPKNCELFPPKHRMH